MALFLGLDVGGSRTVCAVGDESRVLGRGEAGSCKLPQVSPAQARRELHKAIRAACRDAGITPKRVDAGYIGMAGFSNHAAAEQLWDLAQELVPAVYAVTSDAQTTLEAAFPAGAQGVVVIAGTGSMAYGRTSDHRYARAGGWGPAVSDEGSGHWIGRLAVAATLRVYDTAANHNKPLPIRVLRAWKAKDAAQLALKASAATPADFARLAPEVLAAAAERDTAAQDILARAGTELADLAHMVMRRLWPGREPVSIAGCGGVFDNAPQVRQVFESAVLAKRPNAVLHRERVEPVLGALALARRAASPAAKGGA